MDDGGTEWCGRWWWFALSKLELRLFGLGCSGVARNVRKAMGGAVECGRPASTTDEGGRNGGSGGGGGGRGRGGGQTASQRFSQPGGDTRSSPWVRRGVRVATCVGWMAYHSIREPSTADETSCFIVCPGANETPVIVSLWPLNVRSSAGSCSLSSIASAYVTSCVRRGPIDGRGSWHNNFSKVRRALDLRSQQ